ncbi:MAG: 2-polyprenylphenol 6-hydroxylase [Bosea sp. (in: a-proteobacteria)]
MAGLIFHLPGMALAGYALAREGALALIDPAMLPPVARPLVRVARLIERKDAGKGGVRLAAALTRLGPSYVKFGQFLATRADIVGPDIARDLGALQDRMPAFPKAEAIKIIEAALACKIDAHFVEISEPVAAASIAQVHKARLKDGREMALKVVRPGIRSRFRHDLDGMAAMAAFAERHSAEARRLRISGIVETLARSVVLETDLRLEAAALSELAENAKEDTRIRIPKPDWERTARDVLVAEWVDATPLHDITAITAAGHDKVALGRLVIQTFLTQAIRDGFFHADMHQGNLMVDGEGRLVMLDCGIMGRLGLKERRFLAEILLGFITRDYCRVAQVHFEAGYVPAHHDVAEFAQAIRAIGEPIHDRSADQISMAKLLTLLFEITGLFEMTTRTELVMLQKTMVVVEGVARGLDPQLDMWRTAEPVVREWITRNLGPIGRIEEGARGALSFAGSIAAVPDLVSRAQGLAEQFAEAGRHGFTLDAATVRAIGEAEGRGNRWLSLGVWALVGLALYALFA